MSLVRETVEIDAPPAEVWRTVSDPHNLPRWNPHIRAVTGAPDGPLATGDRYVTEMRILGVKVLVRAQVIQVDAPRYSEILLTGPLEATVRTRLRPIGHARTRLDHEVDYHLKGGPVGELVSRAVKLLGAHVLLKRGAKAQKRQIELG